MTGFASMQKVAVADIIEVVHAFPAVTTMQVVSANWLSILYLTLCQSAQRMFTRYPHLKPWQTLQFACAGLTNRKRIFGCYQGTFLLLE